MFQSAVHEMASDWLFALRSLRKTPLSTGIALVSFALGIGATTAMYSVIYGVVIDPFPYKDVDRLMSIRVSDPANNRGQLYYTPAQFLDLAERSRIFSGVAASSLGDVLWTGENEPQRLRGNYISANGFEVMGVPPLIGRVTSAADVKPGAAAVTVLGYRFWMRQFGGKRDVLGKVLMLNDVPRTVIGVMPPRFMWRGADVYVPLAFARDRVLEGVQIVHVVGRLKNRVSDAQAEADLRPIIADMEHRDSSQFPFPGKWRVGLLSFKETFPSGIRRSLWILFGAVGLLLLIACANVSGLLLTKALGRQQELAMRACLGAARWRIIRLLIVESVLFGLVASIAGVALAFAILQGMLALIPPGTIPDESVVRINLPVLWFTLGVTLLTSFLFGLLPAWHGSRTNLATSLREVARGTTQGTRQRLLRNGLVVAELALSIILLVGATLTIRTLLTVEGADLGFRPERILTLRVPLSDKRYTTPDQRNAFFRQLLERVEAIPSVTGVGLNTSFHPLGNFGFPVEVGGKNDARPVQFHQVNPGYLSVFEIRLLAGRTFSSSDVSEKRSVAIVNQAFTKRFFGGVNSLGATVSIPRLGRPPFVASITVFQIIGVSRDLTNNELNSGLEPEIFVPYTVVGFANELSVRAAGEPASVAAAVRRAVYAIDANQPVDRVQPLSSLLNEWIYSGLRFNTVLFGFFAAIGLCLAAIGVYGVLSQLVSQRKQEIGVRMAVGATPGQILGLVIGQSARLIAFGLALGLLGSLVAARVLEDQLANISVLDPLSYGAVIAGLCMVACLATLLPALRAVRIDPARALRYE